MTSILDKSMDYLSIPTGETVAVACSGGPDSMALALLANAWRQKHGHKLVVITVNHGLRPEAAAEAKQVKSWMRVQGIEHVILSWQGKKPASNLQEEARKARYQLMAEYCLSHNISHLLVAHTLEDQAETFLLRLARGSGVDGLSAMADTSGMYGITLHRPLLKVSKQQLLAYLKRHRQDYVRDPSNENTRFDRVKFRKAMPLLTELGITPARLAATASNMARARECLEEETQRILGTHCNISPEGYALLTPFKASEEIALRVIAHLVMVIGGHEVRPRLQEVERLWQHLNQKNFKGATLGGCQFAPYKQQWLALRESAAVQQSVSADSAMWDRFHIHCTAPKGWKVGALGMEDSQQFAPALPRRSILYTLPALRDRKGRLRAVPHLGLSDKTYNFTADFAAAAPWRQIPPKYH